MKRIIFVVALVCGVGGLVAAGSIIAHAKTAPNQAKQKEFRIERSIPKEGIACIECHKRENPGIFTDWAHSRHAAANITCIDCHKAEKFDPDVDQTHYKQYERADTKWGVKEYKVPITADVSPKDCSRCHPDEAKQYARSKHANTLEIVWKVDAWFKEGMASNNERRTGCLQCHGSVLKMKDGKLDPATWPTVGVGRINLDGSRGSCTSCHTRHRFSVAEARKPEACGQCHLGPDHPQIEIFTESKHGDIYKSYGANYNWDAAPGTWTAGVDYRGPTCASCHMSGGASVLTTHDVTERLSWELQAPLTVRPQNFKPFPAKTNWKVERDKMKAICMQCHTKSWVDNRYAFLDKSVEEYNNAYFKPAKKMLKQLYDKGLLDKSRYFDETPEWDFYELWHHEGRRARMGTAMMGQDYAWWHGFYDCKKTYDKFMEEARDLIKNNKKAYRAVDFPNATGNTKRPPEVMPRTE